MFGLSKTRTSTYLEILTEKRLSFWKETHDHTILDVYACNEFFEITTRHGTWRVYGTNKNNFYIVEK